MIYSSADLFVAASIQEAFGKTWVEAMACETPVVCFDKTCASEIIDHKINGYVAKNFDPNELKEGIEWLCKNSNSKTFNKNNLKSKIINFDAKFIAKKYIELYINVLNSKQV